MVFDGNVITKLVDGVEVISYTDDGVEEGLLIPVGRVGFGSDIVDLG